MAEITIQRRSTGPTSTAPRLPSPARVTAGQVRYQVRLLMRTPRALIAGLVMPGALLALQLGKVQHLGGHAAEALLATRVAGLIVLGTMSIAYLTHASGLVTARENGVLRRWRATPLPSWGYFAGRIIATVVVALAAGVILLLVGVAMAGLRLTAGAVGGLLIAEICGALALAAAGTAITPLITSAQGANPLLTLTYIPLIIFSGGLGAISGLPSWLTTLMSYLPAQPMVDAATRALDGPGRGLHLITGHDLIVLAAWMAGSLLISVRFFAWDPHRPAHARHQGQAAGLVRHKGRQVRGPAR